MTFYEHTMIGIDGALALGLPRRYGWGIVALAGFAAILPDADGLTLLLGPTAYALGHRAWGHNLLVAGLGNWELPLFWPFSQTMFSLPMVPWGDVGTTLILILGMFAMFRWPARWQPIAWIALAMATATIVLRGLCF